MQKLKCKNQNDNSKFKMVAQRESESQTIFEFWFVILHFDS